MAPSWGGWRVARTADNGLKSQRISVTLPSPVRIHSIQLNTKGLGKIAMYLAGLDGGPTNYVGQAAVSASARQSGNYLEAMPPFPLTHLEQALTFNIGKGEGKLKGTAQ